MPPIPVLYAFSGLPGTGKSSLAQWLALRLKAVYLRIDTVEQAMRELCHWDVQGEGYRLSYRIAADNLRLGLSVVSDCCNPIDLTRKEWAAVASGAGAQTIPIEILCSDVLEHQRRVQQRSSPVPGLVLPTWEEVQQRTFHAWDQPRVVIDTAGKSMPACLEELVTSLEVFRHQQR